MPSGRRDTLRNVTARSARSRAESRGVVAVGSVRPARELTACLGELRRVGRNLQVRRLERMSPRSSKRSMLPSPPGAGWRQSHKTRRRPKARRRFPACSAYIPGSVIHRRRPYISHPPGWRSTGKPIRMLVQRPIRRLPSDCRARCRIPSTVCLSALEAGNTENEPVRRSSSVRRRRTRV